MLKKLFLIAALSWTSIIVFLFLVKSSEIPTINIVNIDKVVHAFFHFVFTTLWFLFFKEQFKNSGVVKLLIIAFSLSVFLGITIEIFQQLFTTTRNGDVLDVVANMIGAITAVCIILFLSKPSANKIT